MLTCRLFVVHKYLKDIILNCCFYVDNFTNELLFYLSYTSSSELIFTYLHKARFVFVLYPSVNILTEL